MFADPIRSGFPTRYVLPEQLMFYATERTEHFHHSSVYYNNIMSIGATGIDNGRGGGFETIIGASAVKMNGRSYSFIPQLNSSNGGLRYFTHDDYPSVAEHAAMLNDRAPAIAHRHDNLPVRDEILRAMFNEQKDCNEFASELVIIGNEIRHIDDANQGREEFIYHNGHQARLIPQFVHCHRFDVSSVIQDDVEGTQSMSYRIRLHGQYGDIKGDNENLEPILYPLLYPYGEPGWSTTLFRTKKILFGEYVRAKVLMPDLINDDLNDPEYVEIYNHNDTLKRRVSRYQIMSRLGQYFIVESFSRMVDRQLEWQSKNQNYMLGIPDNNREDEVEGIENEHGDIEQLDRANPAMDPDRQEDTNTNPSFLSSSVTGSPRHLRKLALNALGVVAEKGKPHVFVTVTCNELWPEIQETLLKGQSAFDRPDVVVKVFKARLRAILYNLKNGKYFGSKTAYILQVIEYQHRGLPHAHIIIQLVDGPNHQNIPECIAWIDQYISATMPIVNETSTDEDRLYYGLVNSKMIHSCYHGIGGCLASATSRVCKRNYTDTDVRENTFFDAQGFPIYRRPLHEDLRIVPHNRQMLLDCDCHINVEFCGTCYTVLYLYSYLFKGNKKIKFELNNTANIHENDEINLHLRGRMVCSMDAFWRFMGYQTYPASDPPTCQIDVSFLLTCYF